jgi:NAD(P)-dependent dehydrogenase (short-subunit alcohol dehydrogenase family)
MAHGLAQAGGLVLLNGRTAEPLHSLADAIVQAGGCAESLAFDVTDAQAVAGAVATIAQRFGRLDVLINNAYHGSGGSLVLSADADFEESYSVAVTAAARLIRNATGLLHTAGQRNPGGASIINISSMYGIVSPDFRVYDSPAGNNPPFYGAAKAALIQLSRYLACQLAPQRIRVNALSPGPFPSTVTQREQPAFCAKLAARVPLARIGDPVDLAGPAVFLASDAAAFVTGTNLVVDGGWTAW